jgi:heme A synthase
MTLLHQAPLPLALLHQITGIAVLTITVIHAERLVPQRAVTVATEPLGVCISGGAS